VVFEDAQFVAVDKPSGLASHGGSGVVLGLIEAMRQWHPSGARLELVHRLDRDTSGVIVLAKTRPALVGLQKLIANNQVNKVYLALLNGRPKKEKFDVNAPLDVDERRGGERTVTVSARGKPSLSFFKVESRHGDATLCQVKIATGRTHQIRVHAQHIGHPLLGDSRYGDADANAHARKLGLKRLFLHAQRVEFTLGREYFIDAPLDPALKAYLNRL
jgi:23S rRNA pseudouridine955/2504/2580 synthase